MRSLSIQIGSRNAHDLAPLYEFSALIRRECVSRAGLNKAADFRYGLDNGWLGQDVRDRTLQCIDDPRRGRRRSVHRIPPLRDHPRDTRLVDGWHIGKNLTPLLACNSQRLEGTRLDVRDDNRNINEKHIDLASQ